MLSFRQKLKLIGFAIGILTCYTIFGLVQEQIFRGRYGNDTIDSIDGKPGEKFRQVISFGLMQSIFYTTFGKSEQYIHSFSKFNNQFISIPLISLLSVSVYTTLKFLF
jgi:hypothetical protein